MNGAGKRMKDNLDKGSLLGKDWEEFRLGREGLRIVEMGWLANVRTG